jgi:integrase
MILKRAGIKKLAQFHDLRRTALSRWLADGMSEYEVMTLAVHSSFNTTNQFYLAVYSDLINKARQSASWNLLRVCCAPSFVGEKD